MNVGELIERLQKFPKELRVVTVAPRGELMGHGYDDIDEDEIMEITIAPDAQRDDMDDSDWTNKNPHAAIYDKSQFRDYEHEKAVVIESKNQI